MSSVVIVGAQWGDEGKGKIVDLYTERADVVVRFAGGPNAGHTLVVGDAKMVLRLVPSGILRAGARCVMAQGMVVDPGVLVGEIDALVTKGHDPRPRLVLSDRAHLVLPYHILVDGLRESAATEGNRLGTTKRGIGPCYEDKAARRGVRAGDLRDPARVQALVERGITAWEPTIRALGGEVPSPDAVLEAVLPLAPRLVPLLADTSAIVDQALKDERCILL